MSMILRNKTNVSFTSVDNEFIFNSALSTKAKGLLLQLLALPDNWKFSKEGIYAIVPEGKAFVEACLKELKEQGYLVIQKSKNVETNFYEYTYYVYSVSRFCEYLPDGNIYNFKTNKKGRGIVSKKPKQEILTEDVNRDELLISNLQRLIKEENGFSGTVSQLKDHLCHSLNIYEGKLSKLIRDNVDQLKQFGIIVEFRKSNGRKIIEISSVLSTLQPTLEENTIGSVEEPENRGVEPTLEKRTKKFRGQVEEPENEELQNQGLYKRRNNKDIRLIEKEIAENIDFDSLMNSSTSEDQKMIKTIYESILDVMDSKNEETKLGSEIYSTKRIQERMMQLRKEHIEYVIESVKKQSDIKNINAYLLKCLFNAPKSMKMHKFFTSKNQRGLPDWYDQVDESPPSEELLQEVLKKQRELKTKFVSCE